MEYDLEKINKLFRGISPRKVSIISRLAGLNPEEIRIMRMKWLEGKSDIQICDEMAYSPATLTRKRRNAHLKIMDALDLYGLSDFTELPMEDIFSYEGLFYEAQDSLVRFFIRNNKDKEAQIRLVSYLKVLSDRH